MSGGLPKGWVETTFPHVALLNPKSSLDDDTEVAFVPMPHVPTNFSDTLRFEKKLWRDVKRGFTHFRNDDVIFAKITPCFENGKAAIVTGLPNAHGAGSTEFYVLRPVIVPSALLFYWVKTAAFLKTAEAHMTGTVGQKRVPKTFVESHPFPLPPLNEQKRIVAKLDAIMPRIDSVKERLEKIPAILKRFRQSVLTAAVTGKLTEKWRGEHPETESADILLEKIKIYRMKNCTIASKLSAIEKKESGNSSFLDEEWSYSLPDTWMHCEIDSIGDVFNGSTPSRKVDSYWNGQINWVRSGEVANVRISSTRERITQEGFENSSVKLFPKGTVLVAMIGEGKTRGQAAILDVESTCNQNVAAIVINHGYVLSEYLYSWFLNFRRTLTAEKSLK